jgi:hypothetical protein
MSFIWMSLTPETAELNGTLIQRINQCLHTIKSFAGLYWHSTEADLKLFSVTKIDATIDMLGAFLPKVDSDTYSVIKKDLQDCVDMLVAEEKFKFFRPANIL